MRQFCVTTSMGKRLIGKAMVSHPDIKDVLEKGWTLNKYEPLLLTDN